MLTLEFLHQAILGVGGVAIAIPIALHLMSRRKPSRVPFPALQFLQAKEERTRRRLHVQHWLLLMLRCFLLGLFALLLSRPRVANSRGGLAVLAMALLLLCVGSGGLAALLLWGERRVRALLVGAAALSISGALVALLVFGLGARRGMLWRDQEEPVAAALVVDTAPYMGYQHGGETRLQQAQRLAAELLDQFPAGSEIGVVDTNGPLGALLSEKRSVLRTIKNRTLVPQTRPIRELVAQAATLLNSSQLVGKEMYVFSDLATVAWDPSHPELWRPAREQTRSISVQVLDVGVADAINVGLASVRVSPEITSTGQSAVVEVSVESRGPAREVGVELAVESAEAGPPTVVDGQIQRAPLVVRDLRTASIDLNGTASVRFELIGLVTGMHHGVVRLRDLEDGLSADNERYFSIQVRPARRCRLVSWDPAAGEILQRLVSAVGYTWEATEPDRLEVADDSQMDLLVWLDPPPLPAQVWRKAGQFVQRGGGLLVALGPRARPPDEFSSPAAMLVLPAANRQMSAWSDDEPLAWQPADLSHPALRWFEPHRSTLNWSAFPVFRHWYVGAPQAGTQVVVSYSDGQPAILDRALGDGHVLLFTTPLGQALYQGEAFETDREWNRLLRGEVDDWPPFAMIAESLHYLSDPTWGHWNFQMGQPVRVGWKDAPKNANYQLYAPDNTWQTLMAESDGYLRPPLAEVPGTYHFVSTAMTLPRGGFSLNLSPEATQLARTGVDTIRSGLQLPDWQFGRTVPELRRNVRFRGSHEVYAPLLVLLAVVLACEHIAANQFYASRNRTIPQVAEVVS